MITLLLIACFIFFALAMIANHQNHWGMFHIAITLSVLAMIVAAIIHNGGLA